MTPKRRRQGMEPRPVERVVHRAPARPRVARHFVLREAPGRQRIARPFLHGGDDVVVGHHQDTLSRPRPKGCPAFERQRIGGNMIGSERQHAIDGPAPVVHGLVRQAEHQVDGHVVDSSGAGGANRDRTGGRVVVAADRPQEAIVERLDSQRQSVHALLAQRAQRMTRSPRPDLPRRLSPTPPFGRRRRHAGRRRSRGRAHQGAKAQACHRRSRSTPVAARAVCRRAGRETRMSGRQSPR